MAFRILHHGCKALALLLVSAGIARCSGSTVLSTPTPPPAVAPAPAPPTGLHPTVTGIRPSVVSTAGSWGTITGTQFEPGATMKVGNGAAFVTFVSSTELRFGPSPPHGVGTVDVTVVNPLGFSVTLPAGYRYVEPDAFDINGEWIAHAGGSDDYTIDMRFTIRNDVLVSLSCGMNGGPALPAPLQIVHGSFSLADGDGARFSGAIVSNETSHGQTNAPGCGDGYWWADKGDLSR